MNFRYTSYTFNIRKCLVVDEIYFLRNTVVWVKLRHWQIISKSNLQKNAKKLFTSEAFSLLKWPHTQHSLQRKYYVLTKNTYLPHRKTNVVQKALSYVGPSLWYNLNNTLKKTHNSFKKWPLKLWWISNKTIIEVEFITKATTFKSFLHLSYKNTQLPFLWQYFLIFSWDKH